MNRHAFTKSVAKTTIDVNVTGEFLRKLWQVIPCPQGGKGEVRCGVGEGKGNA